MTKKHLVTSLYVLAVTLLLTNVFLKFNDKGIEALYWLGVAVFAVAVVLEQSNKKKEKANQ